MKINLAVNWAPSAISLLLFKAQEVLGYERIVLQEAYVEETSSRVAAFKKNFKIAECLLVLPRSEVIQKAITVPARMDVKTALETKLAQLLPYSVREMAYGLSLEDLGNETRGLVYAITGKKLQEILRFLTEIGIQVTEIVSEDQVLHWAQYERTSNETALLMDQNEERLLSVITHDGKIVSSRNMGRHDGMLESMISETGFSLLETGK